MQVTGTIKAIGETKTFGNNGFRKREVVVTTDEQYPQHIQIEFVQDKCDLLNSYNVGETATINVNLRGREWINPEGEAKYFNTIQGWRIAKDAQPTPEQFESQNKPQDENSDDLPF